MKRKAQLGRLCAVAAAATARELAAQLRQARQLVSTVELRLDWLRGDGERRRFLAWLGRQHIRGPLIATCRRRPAGGRFTGGIAAQRAVLEAATRAGCRWYDIEIETLEASGKAFQPPANGKRRARPRARAIVSLHRFRRVRGDPSALLRRFRVARGAIWKLAARCRGLGDALRLLRLASKHQMVVVPMGREAMPARILSLREGSLLTYAAVSERTAPGQPGLLAAKRVYRAEEIGRRTKVYGVIGGRVNHSVSPAMHNAAFQERGVNAVYLPFPVADLQDFLGAVGPLGIRGFSVTIPYKRRIIPHLAELDPLAKRLGAVNTVVVRRGGLCGYNTDYLGVLGALRGRVRLPGCRALVLGAGGAARAAAFALSDSGASVRVWARRAAQARALARAAGAAPVERAKLHRESFDLIVNATPVGMEPDEDSPLDARELNAAAVFDMIYRPIQTPLLRAAAARGLRTIAGVEMLVAQGTAQWELWTGLRAPAARMRRAAVEALGNQRKTG
ncbi:MAG TPA: shikimate dehydrogenase [Candidatus Acidoferrales bacterium]|nr:shikimate dehydrogenase [Candidatus Acidoferrales bacterium]